MFKKFFSSWSPAILWAGLIFYLSSLSVLPPTGNWFFDFIVPNLAHLTEYGILFALIWRGSKSVSVSFFLAIIYAFSDEFHQTFVPGRTADPLDLLIDVCGMMLASLALWKLQPKVCK
ncbi:VanZ family protein, partial [Candidatus Gottesmanbacteria bacterium]|nr:VanZ family protein [Candidatus Gottesmanbacteria bacterium]